MINVKDEGDASVKYESPSSKANVPNTQDIMMKQEARERFNIYKTEGAAVPAVPRKAVTPQKQNEKDYNADEFKRFLLACIFEKRIPKQEILVMNLVQNIATLRQAVEDERMPLKQALKLLLGLQKVYLRRMTYLHEDSKMVLAQL